MNNDRTPFERICNQPYAVFLDRATWYAAPLWWIQEQGYRPERIWKPAK